ncbi:Beta-barrel assembly machine subunit BamA [Oceanicella actignis]|nr:Beta-barrel assembly machine subunit BamA [Oceanicella actignis]
MRGGSVNCERRAAIAAAARKAAGWGAASGRAARLGAGLCAGLALAAGAAPALAQAEGPQAGPAAAARKAAAEPGVRRVARILVEGNRRVSDATVKAYMTVQEGDSATDDDVNASLRRLIDTGLFEDVSIAWLADGLLVQVVEAPSINRVVFEGNDALDDDALRGVVRSTPRAPFSRAQADADARAITEIYRRAGRYGATVAPKIVKREGNRVDLVFEIDEGARTGVRAIEFVGNKAFSDRRLKGAIQTSESGILGWLFTSDVYDPDRLEFDKELLRRHYLDRGYADVAIRSATAELTPDREDFVITFVIDEGEVYTFGDVTVQSDLPGLDGESLRDALTMKPGETYSARQVDKTIEALTYRAGLAGYAFNAVRPVARKNPETRTVDVTFRIAEGPRVYVERLEIEGNTRTIDRVLRRQFRFAEGDAYNAQAIAEGRNNLRKLGYFSKVDVRTEQGSAPDRAVVKVSVEEQLTGSISFGVGFSSADGVLGDISISERNFLGRGQRVSARVNYTGDEQALTFSFEEPALLDRDLAVGFNLGYVQVDRTDTSSYQETNAGFRPYVEFPLSEDERLRLRYRLSSDEIRDVTTYASPAIVGDEGTRYTSSIGFDYLWDRRDDPIEPSNGFIYSFKQDFAGLGGDSFYSRSVARAKGWRPVMGEDSGVVASLELEAGALFSLGDDPRVTDRFFLGGDTFRGFENGGIGPRDVSRVDIYEDGGTGAFSRTRTRDDALGGNYYAVMRAELTFPLGLPDELGFYGGAFADMGTLFGLDRTRYAETGPGATNAGNTVVIDDGMSLRASIGVSLFVDSALGPLRFNFAYPLLAEDYDEKEYFRFTAGTRF